MTRIVPLLPDFDQASRCGTKSPLVAPADRINSSWSVRLKSRPIRRRNAVCGIFTPIVSTISHVNVKRAPSTRWSRVPGRPLAVPRRPTSGNPRSRRLVCVLRLALLIGADYYPSVAGQLRVELRHLLLQFVLVLLLLAAVISQGVIQHLIFGRSCACLRVLPREPRCHSTEQRRDPSDCRALSVGQVLRPASRTYKVRRD